MFPIWSDLIVREAASRIFSLAKEKGISIFAAGDHALITADSKPIRTLLSKINVHDIPVRDPLPDERFAVISLVESDVHPYPEFDMPGIKQLHNRLSLDIIKSDISKYEGIKAYMKEYGLSSYMAFGDELNDLEMLSHADVGVAMADGQAELLQQIPRHCPSVREGGIRTWLKENGYI